MDEDITLNPENPSNGMLERQREEMTRTREVDRPLLQVSSALIVALSMIPRQSIVNRVVIPLARLLVLIAVRNSTLMPTSVSRAADISSTMSAVSVVPVFLAQMLSVRSVEVREGVSSVQYATR